jgi:hypothetical protein
LAIFTYLRRSLTISGKDVTNKGLMWLCGHGLGEDDRPPFPDSKKDEFPSFWQRERDDLSPLRYNKKDDIYHRDSEERGGQPTNKTICHPR